MGSGARERRAPSPRKGAAREDAVLQRGTQLHCTIISRPFDVPGDGGLGSCGARVTTWKYTD